MEENQKPKSFEERQREYQEKENEKNERMARIRIETMNWLESDSRVKEFFKEYSESSVQSFLEHYASQKALFMEYGENFGKWRDQAETEYLDLAVNCLESIQLEKLYALRRKWGARKMKLPQIECVSDFRDHAENILSSELVTPITQQEVDLMAQFLKSIDLEVGFPEMDLMSSEYNFLYEEDDTEESEEMSAWTEFYNLHTGAGKYRLLPDLMGEKSRHYMTLSNTARQKEFEKQKENNPTNKAPKDERPWLSSYNTEVMESFIRQFEPADTMSKYRGFMAFESQTDSGSDDDEYINEQVPEIVEKMLQQKLPMHIEAHPDWRRAIMITWNRFVRDQVLLTLPIAYEDYLFRLENKIAYPPKEHSMASLAKEIKDNILKGRALNGEPENFDF